MNTYKPVQQTFLIIFSFTLLFSQINLDKLEPPKGYFNMTFLKWAVSLGFLDLVDLEPEIPDSILVSENIVYKETDQRPLLVDIYKRKSMTKSAPVIIFIHGGGWHMGDKKDYLVYCLSFVEKGYVTASLSYRFSQEAIFPAPLEDIICGIRWIKLHGSEFGIDSSKVALVGGSAGAHLAMMAAYTADESFFESGCNDEGVSTSVQAIVNLYGPTDLTTDFAIAQKSPLQFLGYSYADNPEIYLKASPIHYISSDDPPTLTFHGTLDNTVPIYQGDILDKALTEWGVIHEYYRLKGWPHTMDAVIPVNEYVQEKMTRFFDKWLKGY